MSHNERGWPDKMTDEEAVTRLQSILIAACEGDQELSRGREYRSIGTALIRRSDLTDVVPAYVRAHRDLRSFWAYIKGVSPQWAPRREHVWSTFKPLFDRVEGRTAPPVASQGWTGKRSATQQARIVLSLGYDALLGVEMLLDEQERPLGNGGPVEPERLEAIERLRELHTAIGELIAFADAGRPIDEQLAHVRSLKDKAIHWSASPAGLSLGGIPLLGMSTVLGVGVMYLINAICPGQGQAFGVAALGAHTAAAAVRASVEKRGRSE